MVLNTAHMNSSKVGVLLRVAFHRNLHIFHGVKRGNFMNLLCSKDGILRREFQDVPSFHPKKIWSTTSVAISLDHVQVKGSKR